MPAEIKNQPPGALPMPLITRVAGGILIATGLLGFVLSGFKHFTALIPLFIGAPLLGCGVIGRDGDLRKHFMHAAALLSLMGFLGALYALSRTDEIKLDKEAGKAKEVKEVDLQKALSKIKTATISKTIMAVVCLSHLGLCILSFSLARRQREAAAADAETDAAAEAAPPEEVAGEESAVGTTADDSQPPNDTPSGDETKEEPAREGDAIKPSVPQDGGPGPEAG